MTKKVFIGILVSILLSLCSSFCFAATNTDKVNLGNDVSSSIDKGVNSIGDAAKGIVNGTDRAVRDTGDAIGNMGNRIDSNNNHGNYNNNNRNYNNGNYSTTRTSVDNAMNSTGMSTTTWMWVIFAIAAVIIIAAIWYYAMQSNDRD